MNEVDLNSFVEWVREKKNRYISIEIGASDNNDKIKVWAYDYGLQAGQFVDSVSEIDLEKRHLDDLKAKADEYERALKTAGQIHPIMQEALKPFAPEKEEAL
ncbi:MAG: hypothetical protein PHO15_08245 [Eubacteriales bacterium]|nr:hypothetical protein [Eubacteriales bacterium]